MNLCIDTSVAVELIRGRKPLYRTRFEDAQRAEAVMHLSPIVLHELVVGARLSARPDHQMILVEHFCSGLVQHDWTNEDALEAAAIRADLLRSGKRIERPDILIAGQCRRRGWTLVTGNIRDFERIPGLPLEHWGDA